MIQRIQSVFLFLIGLLMIGTLLVPIWEARHVQTEESIMLTAFTIDHSASEQKEGSGYIAALAILAGITAFYSLMQYRNRLLQMKLGLLNSLLMSALLGTFFFGMYSAKEMISPENFRENYQIGFFFPIAGLILNLLANRFIKRDEALVRSVDRLR